MLENACTFERAAHVRKDLALLEACLSDAKALLLPLWRGQAIARQGSLVLLPIMQAADLLEQGGELVWLGYVDERACFGLDISSLPTPYSHPLLSHAQPELLDLRLMAAHLPAVQAELAFYARALLTWHASHGFCSRCGRESKPREGGHLRVCSDERCAAQHFPRTDPCVLALVVRGDACVLGRQPGFPRGMYSTLAGFVEPGETLEQAVAREVLEEVGVRIDRLSYAGSQPWPFPASLMIGFVATTRDEVLSVDTTELEHARWFTRDELRALPTADCFVPPRFALAGQLLAAFVDGRLPTLESPH